VNKGTHSPARIILEIKPEKDLDNVLAFNDSTETIVIRYKYA
jgi:hypothetical protein